MKTMNGLGKVKCITIPDKEVKDIDSVFVTTHDKRILHITADSNLTVKDITNDNSLPSEFTSKLKTTSVKDITDDSPLPMKFYFVFYHYLQRNGETGLGNARYSSNFGFFPLKEFEKWVIDNNKKIKAITVSNFIEISHEQSKEIMAEYDKN